MPMLYLIILFFLFISWLSSAVCKYMLAPASLKLFEINFNYLTYNKHDYTLFSDYNNSFVRGVGN